MISSKIFLGRPYHLFSLSNNIEPDALSCIFKAPEEVIKPTALFVVGGMVGGITWFIDQGRVLHTLRTKQIPSGVPLNLLFVPKRWGNLLGTYSK